MLAHATIEGIAPSAVEELKPQIRGNVLLPQDAAYEQARKVYNAMIDKRPGLIVQCRDVADVIAAVKFAHQHQLLLAVRGGGHNGPGLGTCEGGLVIDLSLMKGISVDPARRTAHAQGGCTLGDLDHATHPFGLATPTGFLSTTGIGGLTLGGGIGYLTRPFGLTLDNLLSADMVLADGSFVTTSDKSHPDLFWAIRGGGGNFGVITAFEFKLYPISTVYGGPVIWPMDQAPAVMRAWREFTLSAPRDINGWLGFITVPPAPPFPEQYHGHKMCAIVGCYVGPLEHGEESFKAIRGIGNPAIDMAGPIPYPALQSMFDALYPAGLQWYWKADFFKDLPDQAIDTAVKYAEQLPTPFSTIHYYPISGAAHDVASGDSAFSYREANWAEVIVGVDPDPANNPKMIEWARNTWTALHPYSAGGAYINFMMDEGHEQVQAAYRENYQRLAQIKAKYDPDNLFCVNQNIQPAG